MAGPGFSFHPLKPLLHVSVQLAPAIDVTTRFALHFIRPL